MPRARTLLVSALGAAALGFAAFALHDAPAPAPAAPARPSVEAPARPTGAPTVGWRLDHAYRYALTYRAEQRVERALGGAQRGELDGRVDLALDWIMTPIERDGAETLVELRLDRVQRHGITLRDEALLPDLAAAREALTTARAWLRIDGAGRLLAFHVAPETPVLFEHMVQTLAAEAEMVLGEGEAWTARQRNAHGEALSRYTRRPSADGWRIERVRGRYGNLLAVPDAQRIDGRAVAEADWGAGHLIRLRAEETLDADGASGAVSSRSTLTLDLLDITAVDAEVPDLAALETRVPGRVTPSADGRRRALEARIEGLTTDVMMADLLRFGAGGRLPDHNRWLWRATGLIELDPAAAAALGRAFTDPAIGRNGRALVSDLLASAGTPAAQDALRAALDGEAAHADPDRGLLLQRLAFVEAPTAETVDWLGAEMGAGPQGLAAATALGSAAGRIAAEDPARARAAHTQLVGALTDAETPEDRAALLRALGNGGQRASLDAIDGFVGAEEAGVRAAAATALRNIDDPRAFEMLGALAADPAATVQASALDAIDDALRAGRGDAALRSTLAELVDGVAPDNHERLVGLLTRYGPVDAEARAALERLRAVAAPAVRQTIDRALARG